MSDKSLLEQQADLLMENVAGWERSTLARIGKRIDKYGKMSLADVKAINNIAVVNQDFEAITKELAKVTGYNISQIEQMYADLLSEQHLENKPLYDYRNKPFVPFSENIELQALARAYAKATGETMINLAKTKALCVLDRNGNVKGLKRYYTDVLDKAVMNISSGAIDFRTAMRDSIVELGGSGVRINYGGGVTRRLDTAVRQNLLWGAKQASVAYNELIGEELDCDGYEIDWHSNPRPSHAFMQGKQYCMGESRTVDGIKFIGFEEVDPDPINEDGKSASKALEEYGCLHFKTPIICGVSEPRHSPEELKRLNKRNARTFNINGKEMTGYEASQAMRRLETEVRKQKDIRTIARESGDKEQVRRCNARIKACKAKYAEISEITGISQEPKRMSVPRMPKTDGNPLTSAGNGGIIRENSKRPIMPITDQAIQNVPKVSIDGFTQEQNELVQRQHQELLRYARDNNNNKEVAFVFRKDLTDRTVFVGSDDVILFGNGLDGKGNNLFVMHNHPRNGSYSDLDVRFFISNDDVRSFSIVKNNGLVEIITKTEKYSIEKMKTIYGRAYKKFVKNGSKEEIDNAIEYILSKNGGIIEWKK